MSRRLLRVLLATVLVGGLASVAFAFLSASGSGTASAATGTFTPATISGPTGSVSTAEITWSTQATLPGNAALQSGITYRVERRQGTGAFTAVASGGCAGPLAYPATSCTDATAGDGTYDYRVVAVYASWTATSNTVAVTVARATTFAVTNPGTVLAGSTFSVTATAQTAAGTAVPDYSGSVSLALVGGASGVQCTSNTVSTVAGVATFSGCHVDKAFVGYTLRATDNATPPISGDSAQFTVTAAAPAQLSFVSQPSASTVANTAFASQPRVAILDAYGNLTDATASVLLTISGPGATLSCTSNPVAAVAGVATFAGCKVDRAGTGYTLTATSLSLTSATSAAFAITPATATQLAFTTQPGNSTGGIALSAQPVVKVQDASGNTVLGDTRDVTLALTAPNGGTLTCTPNPRAAVDGVVSFSGCAVDKAGTYTLTATAGGLTSALSQAFTVAVGPATKLAFATQPSGTAVAGSAFGAQPVVAIQDAGGNTVTADSTTVVSLALTSGSGLSCTTSTSRTASSGLATFAGCQIATAGTYTLTATSAPALTAAVSSSIIVTAAPATKLAFSTQPSPTGSTGGVAFATQPVVAIQNANNQTVTGDTRNVTLALTTPGGATLSCTTNPLAASAGVATFGGCKVDKAGTYTLTATASGLADAVSTSFTISVGPAAKLAFTAQPSGTATTNVAFATQPVVSIQDAGGNTVSSTASVTLGLTTPGGATLACSGGNSTNAVAGVATFTGCAINTPGTYTLTATSGALASATSNQIVVSNAPATKLAFTTQPSATATAGTAFAQQPVVTIQTAAGATAVSTAPVTLTLTSPGTSTLTCTTNPLAATAGVATFSGCKIDAAGTYTLTASSTGLTSATSTQIVVSAPTFRLTGCSINAGAVGCTGPYTLNGVNDTFTASVQLLDASGNPTNAPAGGTTVTVALPATETVFYFAVGATKVLTTTVTVPAGSSTSSGTFKIAKNNNGQAVGNVTVSATNYSPFSFVVQRT